MKITCSDCSEVELSTTDDNKHWECPKCGREWEKADFFAGLPCLIAALRQMAQVH